MVFVSNALDEEKVFYDYCAKDFTIWQACLLLLWSLSVFVWSLSMFTHKVCEMLQTLIIGCLLILKEI
jgi:DMSO reductase anchor subunit